jgi:hypothetical protein
MFRLALLAGWQEGGKGVNGFRTMGEAYVRFALNNPSHYRVMFGAGLDPAEWDPELASEGAAAFQVLVDALLEMQAAGLVRTDDTQQLARFIWAIVHGIAMLALDRKLPQRQAEVDAFVRYSLDRLQTGIAVLIPSA